MASRDKSAHKKPSQGRLTLDWLPLIRVTSAFSATTLLEEQVGEGVSPSLDDALMLSEQANLCNWNYTENEVRRTNPS